MQPTLPFSLLVLLVARVSASALFTRQSADGLGLGNIPDACQSACGPVETTVNNCQELSCLCNNDVAKQIADCANCLLAVAGDQASSLQAQEQNIIDQYTNACNTSGEPVSSIQVSSVAPSSVSGGATGSASTGTSTSTGPGTDSTATGTSTASSAEVSTSSSAVRYNAHASAGTGVAIFAGLLLLFFA